MNKDKNGSRHLLRSSVKPGEAKKKMLDGRHFQLSQQRDVLHC
jgi:hypothetical protein